MRCQGYLRKIEGKEKGVDVMEGSEEERLNRWTCGLCHHTRKKEPEVEVI